MSTTESGTSTNNNGKGSTYAGTQSADPTAPDGYQAPRPEEDADALNQTPPEKLGAEYENDSSYGDKEADPASAAGRKAESSGEDAAGTPIRRSPDKSEH